jgi:hypothetical protein
MILLVLSLSCISFVEHKAVKIIKSGKDLFERSEITMDAEIATMKKFKVPMDIINLTPTEYEESGTHRYFPNKIVA